MDATHYFSSYFPFVLNQDQWQWQSSAAPQKRREGVD